MMGRASIYRFRKTGKIFIHSESQLQMGVGVASEPYIWLDVNTHQEEVINALIVAMSQSKKGLPNPKDWSSFTKNFISSIGLKRESDLYKDSMNVGVMHKEGFISFTPMINNGNKGFVNVPHTEIKLPDTASIEELSTALETAFSKCE